MFDTASLGITIVFVLLIVLGLLIVLRLLSPGDDRIAAQQVGATGRMDDGAFLQAFLRPIYEDGTDQLDTAVESIGSGLELYRRGAHVEAGEEFIAAGRSVDGAARKFREVLSLVEDAGVEQAKRAQARLVECKRLRGMAKDMEAACDAMLAGRQDEAKALEEKAKGLRSFLSEWKKEH